MTSNNALAITNVKKIIHPGNKNVTIQTFTPAYYNWQRFTALALFNEHDTELPHTDTCTLTLRNFLKFFLYVISYKLASAIDLTVQGRT